MKALVAVSKLLMRWAVLRDEHMGELLTLITATLLKQALERISRVRQVAASSIRELLEAKVCLARSHLAAKQRCLCTRFPSCQAASAGHSRPAHSGCPGTLLGNQLRLVVSCVRRHTSKEMSHAATPLGVAQRSAKVCQPSATVQEQLQAGAPVAASAALLSQVSVEDAPGCFGKLQKLPCLVSFMLWPVYRSSLLEGVVASIGGISSSLSERCTGALVCLIAQPTYMASHVFEEEAAQNAGVFCALLSSMQLLAAAASDVEGYRRRGGVSAGAMPEPLTAGMLCESLLAIWKVHANSARMATPLLKTVNALFTRAVFSEESLTPKHVGGLLEAVKGEGRRCKDISRLCAVPPVLCHLMRCGGKHSSDALQVCPFSLPPPLFDS
jgi:hypothetical protein